MILERIVEKSFDENISCFKVGALVSFGTWVCVFDKGNGSVISKSAL